MGNKDKNKGSSWHKWDLHVHTPHTHLNKAYKCSEEDFIQKLCTSEIDCIGLTNYFKFDEEEFDLKEKIEKRGIKVFYNLEVRLDYKNNKNEFLDFHIIFSDEILSDNIKRFLSDMKATIDGTEKRLADLEKDDFNKAVVNFDQLLECLEEESLNLMGKYLLGFLSRGHGSIECEFLEKGGRNETIYKKVIDKSHFLIHSSDNQKNLKDDRDSWLKYNKPLLQSSDAHKEDSIGKKYTWIKAEKTFEGLKQIIYEPETRVSIDEEKSQDPLHKIDCVGLCFDGEVKITNEKGDIPFCYAGFNETLFFSPNFTCVIGGRGSGKSTLLQLIASKLYDKSLVKGLKHETIQKCIEIQPDTVDSVEYLAQNEVEEFATNVSKFTEAIFNRIDSKLSGNLKGLEKQITENIKKFDEQIASWQKKTKLEEQLKNREKERKKSQNIIDTFTDKDYLDKTEKLQENRKAFIDLKQSKEGVLTFIKELKRVVNFESKENMEEKNSYDKVYNQLKQNICKELEEIDKNIKNGCFDSDDKNIEKLEVKQQTLRQEIGEFLKEKGVIDENIGDLERANCQLADIEKEITDLKREIEEITNKIKGFSWEGIDKDIENFENQIEEKLKEINSVFKEISKNHKEEVKPITIKYRLNEDIFEGVFEDFDKLVDKGFNIQKHQSKIKEYLKEIELKNTIIDMQHAGFIEELYSSIDNKKAAFYETMKDIFDREIHFQIYRFLILKHLRNVEKYKIFEVRYDKRALNETSFGQKCTAVLVVLLSLGNNPIIIDEPEAHLDSALIANYLVTLIKKQKQKRQIIFATHNANFVLNADAEQIIQLKNENNKIVAQSFMIESDKHKEDLLKLEGGEKAFKDRERKYGITKDKIKNKE
ncbi:ATPase [Helicobacter pylori]|uniref:TrlF family AAA-like ATPase n=1 Tax=Helicobacter pylori TaxID=210 RepID=UPI000B5F9FC6|nr:AAA family ATPase [Helicobacter pylori]ASM63445.1 ATPase [Helicobacter pylori]